MNLKLVLLLVIFSVIALQESSAAWSRRRWIRRIRIRIPRIRWRRIIRIPGPIGIPHPFPIVGRDVENELDENDDGFLDEVELAKHMNERDIAELIESLDEDGDNAVSVDEFKDKN